MIFFILAGIYFGLGLLVWIIKDQDASARMVSYFLISILAGGFALLFWPVAIPMRRRQAKEDRNDDIRAASAAKKERDEEIHQLDLFDRGRGHQ